jgi:hypothetical protein
MALTTKHSSTLFQQLQNTIEVYGSVQGSIFVKWNFLSLIRNTFLCYKHLICLILTLTKYSLVL